LAGCLASILLPLACAVQAEVAAPPASSRLLVVAPNSFHSALKEFVTTKAKQIPATLVSLEDVLQQSTGVDDPEKLKRFFYKEWREDGLGYALLVGDVDIFPVRYMVLDRNSSAAFDYAFYPSDLYYSDLARANGSFEDWNTRADGFHAEYFGEVRGEHNKSDLINFDAIDYLPDIAVGRWPVSSAEEVKRVAEKSLAYEARILAEDNPRQRRAAFFAVGGWVDSRPLMGRLVDKLGSGWQVEKRFYSDARLDSGTAPPNHDELRAFLNGGAALTVHAGHGQSDQWEKCFSMKDLALLTNTRQLPVVISAGCSTAHFAPLPPYEAYVDTHGDYHVGTDRNESFSAPPPPPSPYQRDEFNPTCLGEQILKRTPTGAVAYIGCNTGSQPCGLTLVEGFVGALAEMEKPRVGDCWTAAIRHYHAKEKLTDLKPSDSWYPPSIFFQGMKFMLFGDPSLRMPGFSKAAR
jgi:hypothetical protein